ncbi:MAG: DNA-binding response regulator [Coleofasciculus sp. C1-SOL-03]|uniref:response regulator transcription factor n=1 Tax=Coleofasciculus sp. C1-SOL-03 TaxID=3069522 RepID=UPI0033001602
MKKILVIENDTKTRIMFLDYLEAAGFNAIGVENGHIGIQQAQKQLPDLIICGKLMPELNGYEVLTRLRQDSTTAVIPFIFIATKGSQAEQRKCMELGADDYLTQPFTAKELLRAISVRLKRQETLRRWYATPSPDTPSADAAALATCESFFPSIPKLNQCFNFIEANYHQQISLRDVAQAMGYSPAYLTDLVRRQTGESVCRWIIKRRIAEARRLLLATSQSVQTIAEAVGYLDTGYFIRQFRQHNGMTPHVWRQANQH